MPLKSGLCFIVMHDGWLLDFFRVIKGSSYARIDVKTPFIAGVVS